MPQMWRPSRKSLQEDGTLPLNQAIWDCAVPY